MQAQSTAISPQLIALSYAAKHGTPALIKQSLGITTGKNNYSLTLTLIACVQTSLRWLYVHVCLFVYAVHTTQHFYFCVHVNVCSSV